MVSIDDSSNYQLEYFLLPPLFIMSNIRRSNLIFTVSQRTKDTQSLLSIPCGSTHSKRSCCSQRPSREAHGDACMCIVCANRFKFDKDINFKKKILAGHQEEEKRKNVLVGGFSKVDQNEHRQRIENEKRTKELQKNAAKYNSQFVQRKSIKRPKESDSSALENNAIMYNRQNR
jgi:hypothetical protein